MDTHSVQCLTGDQVGNGQTNVGIWIVRCQLMEFFLLGHLGNQVIDPLRNPGFGERFAGSPGSAGIRGDGGQRRKCEGLEMMLIHRVIS